MRTFFLCLVSLIFIGCAAGPIIALDASADRVKVLEYMSPKEKSKYEEVGMVRCEEGMNARSQSTNVDSCRNSIRNQALKLGADVILVEYEQNYRVGEFEAGCHNCVFIKGFVYKSKSNNVVQ